MKKIGIGLLVLVVGLALVAIRTLYYAGAFKSIEPTPVAEPLRLTNIVGAEDISVDYVTGMAFVSSDDRRSTRNGHPVKGAIYWVDLNKGGSVVRNLTSAYPDSDFHPHGISVYNDPMDSTQWVFVVNHRKDKECVEIFQMVDSALVHQTTVSGSLLAHPNDVAAIGRNEFYFTNDHDQPGGISSWKDYLVIGTGQVGYFDGERLRIMADHIRYANGITISPDGERLYVAACTDGSILEFSRFPFQQTARIACGTGVDNLEWDSEGNLWSGGHPKMLDFVAHSKDAQRVSPSEVIQVQFPANAAPQVTRKYLNDGKPFSGSSVAVPYRGRLYIGSVFERGILQVDLPTE